MTALIYKGFIEDISKAKCSDSEIQKLVEVFGKAVSLMAKTSEEKIFFNMIDFEGAEEAMVENFDFTMTRQKIGNDWKYTGSFIDGRKNFKIVGILKAVGLRSE